ncbi:MAG: hypothetical protein JNL42_05320 [Anaerolineae bacterium]|nr:hypothetical protein [Anaerolineae bacterium]
MSVTTKAMPERMWSGEGGTRAITFRVEWLAYVLLALIALALRLAELDQLPLGGVEAREALAAWRALTPNPGAPVYAAQSQIIFLAQTVGFALFGASEFSARLLTALAGGALVLTPLLFRGWLGAGRAFALALLLAASPVLLVASRESDGLVWAALFAAGALWGALRWNRLRLAGEEAPLRAALAASCAAALVFLTGSPGLVLALMLALALTGALLWERMDQQSDESADDPTLPRALEAVLALPRGSFVLTALAVVLAGGTSFLLYPAGLSAVGNTFAGLGLLLTPVEAPPTVFHALVVAFFYEPHLWVLAAVAAIMALRSRPTLIDRLFLLLALLGAAAGIIFDGAPGSAALWLTLPLAGLASHLLADSFAEDSDGMYLPAPGWSRGVVAIGLIGALAVFTLAAQEMARALIGSADGAISSVTLPSDAIVLLFVSTMFIVIGFFLFASLWGARTTWQGVVIGAAMFFGVTSLGSGWSLSVSRAAQAAQVWDAAATSGDSLLLRATLLDLSEREARGFTGLPIHALAESDGLVAWVLRDFPQTTFIREAQDAVQQGVIIAPAALTPELGAQYVGQDFLMQRFWTSSALRLVDFPAFWTQANAGSSAAVGFEERIVLWLRQDIYDGADAALDGAAPDGGGVG